tara:strand:+ start:1637 stop:2278 length:642 start_codon:yes stop_codon:yes gene_type:complete
MDKLKKDLHNYINEPLNPYFNAELGEAYENLGQGAAALSYFLRAAELLVDIDKELSYNCLLKTWKQINKIGRRKKWEKSQLQLAITHLSTRPEAYYLLSKHYSEISEHHEAYLYACLGLKYINLSPLKYDIGYPGDYMLYFLKAYHGWYLAKREESKLIWKKLGEMPNVPKKYKDIIKNNNKNFNNSPSPPSPLNFIMETTNKSEMQEYYINN